jgi:hypothetical protein
MPETEEPKREILGYASPSSEQGLAKPANPTSAVLLCLPAALCWTIFIGLLSGLFRRWFPFVVGDIQLALPLLLSLWFVAVITALASFSSYAGKENVPRPWYLWLNLTLNGAGLLFTLAVVVRIFW